MINTLLNRILTVILCHNFLKISSIKNGSYNLKIITNQ